MADSTALVEGHRCRERGDGRAAAIWYQRAVGFAPGNVEAWVALGDVAADSGRNRLAALHYRRAVRLEPASSLWRRLQAAAWCRAGDAVAAAALLQGLLGERPDDIEALRLLADAWRQMGRNTEALGCYRELLGLDPDPGRDAGAVPLAFAELAIGEGDPLAAIEALEPLLARRCLPATAWLTLARAWAAVGDTIKTRDAVTRYHRDGGDPAAAAAAGDAIAAVLAKADSGLAPAYVRALFDRYADRFDHDLVGTLHYQVPALLVGALTTRLDGRRDLRVLDLGCGTGLAGAAVRPLARVLSGIDLSPRMIDKARQRAIYDALAVGDLQEGLAGAAIWDLILAADVLVYLGDLTPVFAGVARALAPGGLFAGTVERLDAAAGWQLGESRRFAHSVAHLRQAAAAAGLDLADPAPIVPRHDRGQPVSGWLFVAAAR
ncbi:MAG: methyltransferase [Azospirillaceae bacterium]|nr:methyltransferase [Azospirillaceae bacterium]